MPLLEHHGVTDPGKVHKNNEDLLLVGEVEMRRLADGPDGIGGSRPGGCELHRDWRLLQELEPLLSPYGDAIAGG